MPDLSNDMLTLWLRARDGLPADEARALIERLAAMEREQADSDKEAARDMEREAEAGYSRGYKEAHREIADRLSAMLEKCGEADVCQTAMWSFHTDLECEAA
jgi:flagellar biosynthesis/type III secretory pathway protein FliH